MKRILTFVFIISIGISKVSAQYLMETVKKEPKTIIRLSLLAPGLIVEQKISDRVSLNFRIWSGISYTYSNINGETSSDWEFYPSFTFEPRYYTAIKNRKSSGKRTDYLSSGYLGLPMNVGITKSSFAVGPVYGFQRTLGTRGYWNISIGAGLVYYDNDIVFTPIGDFGIGFILN